ncbi:bone marrow stromal antigen 2 [Petaurus breviceps papuanus]|uniref:bone marrow stromal antigen 2 n=1 Tax=Petaurus breviceps papuanus TaxID=3040969 RepID=UPI0036D8BAF4
MYLSMKTEWIKFLAITAILVILVTLLGVYAYRANSETCQQGYLLRNESQLLREKLRDSQESFLQMEAQWHSCGNVSRDLKENLEKMTSHRDSLLSELQKLKGENQNLAEKLRNVEADLQMEREKRNQEETSSAPPGPWTYSLLMGLGLAITLLL